MVTHVFTVGATGFAHVISGFVAWLVVFATGIPGRFAACCREERT